MRYGDQVGTKIWLKRDDHTGSELMGNKVRKLEYLMAEALQQQATHVITCGGEQSNHARASAMAATRSGGYRAAMSSRAEARSMSCSSEKAKFTRSPRRP